MRWGAAPHRLLLSLLLSAAYPTGSPAFTTQAAAAAAVPVAETVVLDINTASAAELKALPGMGEAYVKRVVEGRPYTAKNQLVTRGVLPAAAYERIRERIVAHRAARP